MSARNVLEVPEEKSATAGSEPGIRATQDTDSNAAGSQGESHTKSPKAPKAARPRWWSISSKILHFVIAMFLFILAIKLMTKGAGFIGPRLEGTFLTYNGVTTLGFGWLGAYVVLSGSPVAASAIALFDGGVLSRFQTFTMLSGSRLGASLVVLLVGFLYAIRNPDKKRTIGMGVLALSMTAIVYIPGMLLGYFIMRSGWLDGVQLHASGELNSLIDKIWGPFIDFFINNVPGYLLFPAGLGLILISFKLLDNVLPELDGEKHASARSHWLKKPWTMFGLGCLAALLTLSVSVALTILVPLAAKGYVNRREAIPYIAGANITTLADTLVVAMLATNRGAAATQLVLAEAIAVTIITILYLVFAYKPISNSIIALDDWVVGTPKRTWLFVGALFLTPVAVIAVGTIMGPIG